MYECLNCGLPHVLIKFLGGGVSWTGETECSSSAGCVKIKYVLATHYRRSTSNPPSVITIHNASQAPPLPQLLSHSRNQNQNQNQNPNPLRQEEHLQ